VNRPLLCVWLGLLTAAWHGHAQLTVPDLQQIIAQAATRAAQVSPDSVIAIADREGYVLAVWTVNPNPDTSLLFTNFVLANAIAKAGTASFLSSSEHAFSTRTAGFIVQQNFPPGVRNKPPGPLVGVNFSQLPFTDINRFKDPATYNPALTNGVNGDPVPLPVTGGLAGTPGGLPLYKNGRLVGGIGVAHFSTNFPATTNFALISDPTRITPQTIANPKSSDVDEDVALAGQLGFAPSRRILGSKVTIDGIRVAYVFTPTPKLPTVQPFGTIGVPYPGYPLTAPPPVVYPPLTLGGVTGELRAPIIDDPSPVPLPGGAARLTAAEVTNIIAAAAARARITRAGIRLPRGVPMQVFIVVVNNPNQAGSPPVVLGAMCTSPDTTRFSWDVAAQKARTALFFSDATRAFSSRTVGFLAQSKYPPGIQGTEPGPFLGLQEIFSAFPSPFPPPLTNPLNGYTVTNAPAVNPNLPNGITIFPGGFPLYRNGVLIGAIGISGDGIDQDDIVGASGAALFPPPPEIRADRMEHRGARLPYAKFPRNPRL
jgi:uncharacterized protein GlcG (DUF336 family)